MGRQSDGTIALIAAVWGFAEATVFFVVPDVCVTAAGLRSWRAMIAAAVLATLGAVAGGVLMHDLGGRDPARAGSMLARVPGVHQPMVDRAGERLRARGLSELFVASVTGVPFKIEAVHAGAQRVPLGAFVAVGAMARLTRFLAAGALTRLIARALPERLRGRGAWAILGAFWVLLYAGYWGVVGW